MQRAAAPAVDLRSNRLAGYIDDICQHDARAFAREKLGLDSTLPAARAGDERDFRLEPAASCRHSLGDLLLCRLGLDVAQQPAVAGYAARVPDPGERAPDAHLRRAEDGLADVALEP